NDVDGMDEKDLTTWTVVIGAYAACGSANESLVLFDQMQECGIVPDMVTVVNTCGKLGAMNKAKVVHDIVTLVVPLWRPHQAGIPPNVMKPSLWFKVMPLTAYPHTLQYSDPTLSTA
ncbi:pentatricopeptide repeat-containing protein, partial [Tanacetum coccineum]